MTCELQKIILVTEWVMINGCAPSFFQTRFRHTKRSISRTKHIFNLLSFYDATPRNSKQKEHETLYSLADRKVGKPRPIAYCIVGISSFLYRLSISCYQMFCQYTKTKKSQYTLQQLYKISPVAEVIIIVTEHFLHLQLKEDLFFLQMWWWYIETESGYSMINYDVITPIGVVNVLFIFVLLLNHRKIIFQRKFA